MFNYSQPLKLLLLLLCQVAFGQEQQLEPLHRNKRTLTTICVEIQPTGPQNEPYFMCKGADFANDPVPAAVPAAQSYQQPVPAPVPQSYQQPAPQPASHLAPHSAGQLADQPIYNYGQPLTPFPSFPSFAAGFFQHSPSYEAAAQPSPSAAPATPPSPPAPPTESASYGAGSAAAAALPPASAAPSYGLPAVSYPAAGGPAAAARGAAPVAGTAATPTAYAAAGTKKSSPSSIGDSRHRVALDDSVLGMPNVGFRPEELQSQYRQPVAALEPPMAFRQLAQPAAVPHPHYDDPIMRTFYNSLGHQEPQVGQAAPNEPLVSQVAPAAAPEPSYNSYSKSTATPADGNACNSCNRPCSTPADSCPSYQPVIIAMPCYGQQQPTHYLAVPGQPQAAAPARESLVGSAFGGGWPQVAAPFGNAFNMPTPHMGAGFNMPAPQVGAAFGMSNPQLAAHGFNMPSPQVGAPFGMQSPQVGAPFGMAPVLNPFGPFGTLNPFNPFNRILGAAPPTTPQPRLRLFGAPDERSAAPTSSTPTTQYPQYSRPSLSSNPTASPNRQSTERADVSVGASREADDEQKDGDEEDDDTTDDAAESHTDPPTAGNTTQDDADEAEQNKSVESKAPTVSELVTKGEDKLKIDKRKRHNSRSREYKRKLS